MAQKPTNAGLEPVLKNTEKSCISHDRQFFTANKIKIIK